ncbi:MAG: alpha/beta hydrolase [Rhodocyclaceae bacterium]|nr:alpha/beta hydrolase [Rhodocyclaceae bacterium]
MASFRCIKAALCAAFLFLLAGCASIDRFGGSRQAVEVWGGERGFDAGAMDANGFRLLVLTRGRGEVLSVYIEGDGAAWPSPYHPPRDPTPQVPMALALANADRSAVAYLGRPCQYLDELDLRACSADYWTARRFAPEVIAAYMTALDHLKERTGARQLRLVGYSGGGVVATLLAARRADVEYLVTVAAPVAIADWVAWHKVTPLTGSLDPLADTAPLPPAKHFSGADDGVVPPVIAQRFAAARGGRLRVVAGFDHQCCWAREWPRLLEETR